MTRPLRIGAVALVLAVLLAAGWWRAAVGPDPSGAPTGAPDRTGQALIASLRSEPGNYIRYVEPTAAADLVSLLTDARLVQVNRETDEIEPALAESWTQSDDGLTFTLKLRPGVRFSDGTPFTSADVLFTARALYDKVVDSPLASSMFVEGKPLAFGAPDNNTVTVSLPGPFAPGLRLLDGMPILPRHKLEQALLEGRFREAWRAGTPPAQMAGLGPFVLTAHVAGQQIVFRKNPHFWRRDASGVQLPYLERLMLAIVPDQNAEALRMEAGEIDLMSTGEIRPEDYSTFKRASDAGRLRLTDAGVGLDPTLLWFNLTDAGRKRIPWLQDARVRQAISYAVDRQALADTVYLGAAVPVYGPVSPGNRIWFSATVPQYVHNLDRARALLAAAGLTDRNGDHLLDGADGKPARFSILTQAGHTVRERSAAMIQEHLRQVGITVDISALEVGSVRQHWADGNYDSIFLAFQTSATDPAMNHDLWLSSGAMHAWNPGQKTPATTWEARMDDLMRRQAAAPTLEERKQLFGEVQRIMGEELPAIYFVAPRVTIAATHRVAGGRPVQTVPQLLWSAETLSVTGR